MNKFIKDIFSKLDTEENRRSLKEHFTLEFPSDLATPFVCYMMERGYLEDVCERESFESTVARSGMRLSWIRILRLPVHPSFSEEYDLIQRWQSVLSSLHTWKDRFIFLLQRKNGYTNLYIGLKSVENDASIRVQSALYNSMPGIKTHRLDNSESFGLYDDIEELGAIGSITGVPSFRKDDTHTILQTLDQLAFGIKDEDGKDIDFCVLVVADPLSDSCVSDIMARYLRIGSEIHSEVRHSINESEGTQKTKGGQFGMQAILMSLNAISPGLGSVIAHGLLGGVSGNMSTTISYNKSVSTETLNKFAEYTEKLADIHCERLQEGRSLGFWNVGIYVLGQSNQTVNAVSGMLRSIYSGDKTYIEPIRTHLFRRNSGVADIVKGMNFVPLKRTDWDSGNNVWHMLGETYQYVSTPLNTRELSLVTSLPRKDVPGLRFVKTAVRFANNPSIKSNTSNITLGRILDYGIMQNVEYGIDVNTLVRHMLIVGGTGSGKSTTCRKIVDSVMNKNIPTLIIEPAKEEYVRWAIQKRKRGEKIHIFMPGVESIDGVGLDMLRLNPFEPAVYGNAKVDMLTRCEQLTAFINASLPTSDVLPIIMDETLFTYLSNTLGYEFQQGELLQRNEYPPLENAINTAREVLKCRGYAEEVSMGLRAAIETRIKYLSRGKRGMVLNATKSTPWKFLFEENTVINLSHITNAKDKSLIMSLILLALQEYRTSKFNQSEEYRKDASSNKLMHLTVIEEAHNVMSNPRMEYQGAGNPQQVVADMFSNMLSEIRGYGEGLMIVDQVPTKLIPDVMKNTNYKICHRLSSKDDCIAMSSALALRNDQQDIIPTLEVGDVIVSGDKDDAAAWVKIINK